MSYTVPPSHDAWVECNERFVSIEVMSAEQFAKACTQCLGNEHQQQDLTRPSLVCGSDKLGELAVEPCRVFEKRRMANAIVE